MPSMHHCHGDSRQAGTGSYSGQMRSLRWIGSRRSVHTSLALTCTRAHTHTHTHTHTPLVVNRHTVFPGIHHKAWGPAQRLSADMYAHTHTAPIQAMGARWSDCFVHQVACAFTCSGSQVTFTLELLLLSVSPPLFVPLLRGPE